MKDLFLDVLQNGISEEEAVTLHFADSGAVLPDDLVQVSVLPSSEVVYVSLSQRLIYVI